MAELDTSVRQTGPTGHRRFLLDAAGRPGRGLEGPSLHPARRVGALSRVEGSREVSQSPAALGSGEKSLSVALTLPRKRVSPGRRPVAPPAG